MIKEQSQSEFEGLKPGFLAIQYDEEALKKEYPSVQELFHKLKEYLDESSLSLVFRAYKVAKFYHEGQTRSSGEPYILHPVEVARILAEYHLDPATLAAALTHDLLEDTPITAPQMEELFGSEITSLVDGVTKLTVLYARQGSSEEDVVSQKKREQAANLRKIFLAMTKDLRVILIKLADRIHNMRTLEGLRPDKQARISGETLDIFAPIASRLGIFEVKRELEDLCFRYLKPREFEELSAKVVAWRSQWSGVIQEAVQELSDKIEGMGISHTIYWREKHLYSIYKKMIRTGVGFDEIYDIMAVRVIVNKVEDCYSVLGAIHAMWVPLKDRIKDYIAVPKSNNYSSLHTTVFGPKGQPLEIQIRTEEMHKINEFGIAAHWAYKEGQQTPTTEDDVFKEVYPWIRSILDWEDKSKDAKDYIDNLKVDLLSNEVFVFTPQGDVIDLPSGSTPLDFAYRVHTEVGHRCVGARVNGKMVPITYELQNSDIVEIVTSKTGRPSRDWLRICKSNQAKNKIKAWFKKEHKDENIQRGRDCIRRELNKKKLDPISFDDKMWESVADDLNFKNLDDLLASVGYGETSLPQVLNRIRSKLPQESRELILPTAKRKSRHGRRSSPIEVHGLDNVLVKLARCCAPVHGDDIGGYVSLGKGVAVHLRSCPNFIALMKRSPEREIDVSWYRDDSSEFKVRVEILCWDRKGLLSEVLGVAHDLKISVLNCTANVKREKAFITIDVEVTDRAVLEQLIVHLKMLPDMIKVSRGRSK